MDARSLSWALREGQTEDLNRRRRVAALSLVAAGAMGVVSLYQLGLVRRLPEPPGKRFDARRISGSAQAYSIAQIPDAPLALVSYAVTLALAAMGAPDRAKRMPIVPLALAGKVALDAAVSAKLTVDQPVRYQALCAWCLAASAATFAMVPLVVPEAREAWRTLRRPQPVRRAATAVSSVRDRVLQAVR